MSGRTTWCGHRLTRPLSRADVDRRLEALWPNRVDRDRVRQLVIELLEEAGRIAAHPHRYESHWRSERVRPGLGASQAARLRIRALIPW